MFVVALVLHLLPIRCINVEGTLIGGILMVATGYLNRIPPACVADTGDLGSGEHRVSYHCLHATLF
jgi:hypothetical protein